MRIAFSATEEQENEIELLLADLRNELLPLYFSNDELEPYDNMHLLQFDSKRNLYNGTLTEAAAIMVALGVINHLLKDMYSGQLSGSEKEKRIFEQNVAIINYYGFFFPFTWDQLFNHSFEKVNSEETQSFLTI